MSFPIYLDTGQLDYDKLEDICYIITKNGIYLRKKLQLIDSLIKVGNIPFLGETIKEYAQLDIPKISLSFAARSLIFKARSFADYCYCDKKSSHRESYDKIYINIAFFILSDFERIG